LYFLFQGNANVFTKAVCPVFPPLLLFRDFFFFCSLVDHFVLLLGPSRSSIALLLESLSLFLRCGSQNFTSECSSNRFSAFFSMSESPACSGQSREERRSPVSIFFFFSDHSPWAARSRHEEPFLVAVPPFGSVTAIPLSPSDRKTKPFLDSTLASVFNPFPLFPREVRTFSPAPTIVPTFFFSMRVATALTPPVPMKQFTPVSPL